MGRRQLPTAVVAFLLISISLNSLVAASPSNRFHSAARPLPDSKSNSVISASSDHHNHDPAFSNFAASVGDQHIQSKRADGQTCVGFDGDQDTYGLGIRIGLYFQWVTSSIAYNLVPSEAVTMRGVNNAFQAAMFAGLIFVTISKGSNGLLRPIEAYLMLLFCMGGVCSGTIDQDDENESQIDPASKSTLQQQQIQEMQLNNPPIALPRAKAMPKHHRSPKPYAYFETSTLGGYLRLFLGCGFIAYGLWFVFKGMDRMLAAQPDSCRYAFFFVRVELSGWFRTLLKVVFVCTAIPTFLSLLWGSASLVQQAWYFIFAGGWTGRVDMNEDDDEEEDVDTSKNNNNNNNNNNSTTNRNQRSHTVTSGTGPTSTTTTTTTSIITPKAPNADDAAAATKEKPGLQNIRFRKGNAGFSGALILFIIAVELTIKWNSIAGVNDVGSTGQLLPVIIGIGGIGRVLVRFISDLLEEYAKMTKEKRRRMLSIQKQATSGGGSPGVFNRVSGMGGIGMVKAGGTYSSAVTTAHSSPVIRGFSIDDGTGNGGQQLPFVHMGFSASSTLNDQQQQHP